MNIEKESNKYIASIASTDDILGVIDAYAAGAEKMSEEAVKAIHTLVNDLAPYITGLDFDEIGSLSVKAIKSLRE